MGVHVFGAIRSQSGSSANEFRFTGEQVDGTGLQYLRARYYDPQIGRFLSQDPVAGSAGDPQSQNRYPYVTNNPVNLLDPAGTSAESIYETLGVPPPPELNCASGDIPCALAWSADLVAYHYNVLLPALMERIAHAFERLLQPAIDTVSSFATMECLGFGLNVAATILVGRAFPQENLNSLTWKNLAYWKASQGAWGGGLIIDAYDKDAPGAILGASSDFFSTIGMIPTPLTRGAALAGNAAQIGYSAYQCGRSA